MEKSQEKRKTSILTMESFTTTCFHYEKILAGGGIAYVATVYGVIMAVETPSLVVIDLMARERVDSTPAAKEISISPTPTEKKFDGPFPGQRAATIVPIPTSMRHAGPIQSA